MTKHDAETHLRTVRTVRRLHTPSQTKKSAFLFTKTDGLFPLPGGVLCFPVLCCTESPWVSSAARAGRSQQGLLVTSQGKNYS